MCSAGSRLLLQESIYDDFVQRVKSRMSHLRLGHCLDKTIDMGAVVDESQLKSVEELVQSARLEGAQVRELSLSTVLLALCASRCVDVTLL